MSQRVNRLSAVVLLSPSSEQWPTRRLRSTRSSTSRPPGRVQERRQRRRCAAVLRCISASQVRRNLNDVEGMDVMSDDRDRESLRDLPPLQRRRRRFREVPLRRGVEATVRGARGTPQEQIRNVHSPFGRLVDLQFLMEGDTRSHYSRAPRLRPEGDSRENLRHGGTRRGTSR